MQLEREKKSIKEEEEVGDHDDHHVNVGSFTVEYFYDAALNA